MLQLCFLLILTNVYAWFTLLNILFGEFMYISNSLKIRLKFARSLKSAEDLIYDAQKMILKNTNKNLHKRIINKISDLNFDVGENNESSKYDDEKNTVYISCNHVTDINVYLHEIMHAIGTEILENCTIIGLNKRFYKQLDNETKLFSNFGYGANEGLNQLYTETFLDNNIQISKVSNEYSFCSNIIACLQDIVGAEKFKEAHFSGKGVDILINATIKECHLPNENKILKLILQLDAYKKVARTHMIFGAEFSPETRLLLTEAYKNLITIALIKAKHENKDILYSDIIKPYCLIDTNLSYFIKYINRDLIKYFYEEKKHIQNDTPSKFVGIQQKPFLEYAEILFKNYLKTKKIDGSIIPEEIKCGEFYNYILLNCMFYSNDNMSKSIFTSDFQKELTVDIFNKQSNLMPNHDKEKAQLIKQILSSRNVVRCGAEISDDAIIECTKDVDFNVFLIETMPTYYKEIFSKINDEIKYNPSLLNLILKEIYTTRFEQYKLLKNMPEHFKQNDEIKKVIAQNVKLTNEQIFTNNK